MMIQGADVGHGQRRGVDERGVDHGRVVHAGHVRVDHDGFRRRRSGCHGEEREENDLESNKDYK